MKRKKITITKLSIVSCALLVFLNIGCLKETVTSDSENNTTNAKFSEISTPSSFNWNNSQQHTLNFVGSADKAFTAMLKVTANDGSVLFQKMQKGSDQFTTSLQIPAHYETIDVQFGGIKKTFTLKGATINMNIN